MKKGLLFILTALVLLSGNAWADSQKETLYLGAEYGQFRPNSTQTQNIFGSPWTTWGITLVNPSPSTKWASSLDLSWHSHQKIGYVFLMPLNYRVVHAFARGWVLRPFVSLGVGPYYGNVRASSEGLDGANVGLNADGSVGLIYLQRYYVTYRWDFYSKFAGSDFSGQSFSVGMRIFDVTL
jgi:hypothetical protein